MNNLIFVVNVKIEELNIYQLIKNVNKCYHISRHDVFAKTCRRICNICLTSVQLQGILFFVSSVLRKCPIAFPYFNVILPTYYSLCIDFMSLVLIAKERNWNVNFSHAFQPIWRQFNHPPIQSHFAQSAHRKSNNRPESHILQFINTKLLYSN